MSTDTRSELAAEVESAFEIPCGQVTVECTAPAVWLRFCPACPHQAFACDLHRFGYDGSPFFRCVVCAHVWHKATTRMVRI